MEMLQEIYMPAQDTLFSTRSILDEPEEGAEAAADIDEEEIPEFLEGEDIEVYD